MQSLKANMRALNLRADRLREWREFGNVLEKVGGHIEDVEIALQSGEGFEGRVKHAWNKVRRFGIPELEHFCASVISINQPLWSGGGHLELQRWSIDVRQCSEKANQSLTRNNWGDFKSHFAELSEIFLAKRVLRQRMLDGELSELCALTRDLSNRFSWWSGDDADPSPSPPSTPATRPPSINGRPSALV